MSLGTLKTIGDLSFVGSTVGSVAFLVLYSLLARWWRSWIGRLVFSFMAVLALTFIFIASVIVFGRYPAVDVIRPLIYLALMCVIWWFVAMLVKAQIYKRKVTGYSIGKR